MRVEWVITDDSAFENLGYLVRYGYDMRGESFVEGYCYVFVVGELIVVKCDRLIR